jgi:molybdenum-dependent DNA-binding transcriptional regulator ModE
MDQPRDQVISYREFDAFLEGLENLMDRLAAQAETGRTRSIAAVLTTLGRRLEAMPPAEEGAVFDQAQDDFLFQAAWDAFWGDPAWWARVMEVAR